MKKNLKRAFKWSGIALAVLLVILILLPFLFRKQIVQAVKDELNKNLNATVDFRDYGLNLFGNFPDFTLRLDGLSIIGAEEFENDTLAYVDKFAVALNLMSVFKGDYEVKKILIADSRIHLKVLPGGKSNWDIVKTDAEADTITAVETEEPAAFSLKLKKLEIRNATIVYEDFDSRMFARVEDMDHTLRGDLSADRTTLLTNTSIASLTVETGGVSYLKQAKVSLKADLEADLMNSRYTFKKNECAVNELFFAFDGWITLLEDSYDMDLKFSAQKTEFRNFLSLIPAVFMTDFENIQTSGSLAFDGYAKGIYADGQLPAFALNLAVDNGMFRYPELPEPVTSIFINASVSNKGGSPDNTIIDVKKIHFEAGGNPVDAGIYVSTPVSDPQIDAKVKGKLDLARMKDFYPLESDQSLSGLFTADVALNGRLSYIDQKQYEKFGASGTILVEQFAYTSADFAEGLSINKAELVFSPQHLDLLNFEAKTGNSDMKAKGKIGNYLAFLFRDELLTGSFDFSAEQIDLSDFMSAGDPAPTDDPAAAEASAIIELPANIDFALNARIGKVLYDGMDISGVSGTITLKDRSAVMRDLKMQLLQGALTLGGSYSTADALIPRVDFVLDIRDFDIQSSLKYLPSLGKFAPIAEKATGRFSAKLDYASDLTSDMSPEYSTVNASGSLQTRGVTIANAGFFNTLSDELKMDLFRSFKLNDLNIPFKIVHGDLHTSPFDIRLGKSTLTVEGVTSLDETIRYVMKLAIPRSEFGGAANNVLNNMVKQASATGLDIKPGETVHLDILATGTVTKPVFKLGLKGSMQNLADDLKDQAQQIIKQEIENIVDDIKDQANAAMEAAEKKAQQIIAEAEVKARQIREEAKKAGDKLIAEADAQGQKLISEAKNPITKEAAKAAAKKLRDEAQKSADKLNAEADKQASEVVNKARAEAEKLRNDAKKKVN